MNETSSSGSPALWAGSFTFEMGWGVVPFLDLTRQYERIKGEILSAQKRVLEKGHFILGEEVASFEEEFARYCGVRYGVGVGSGTDALFFALKAAGIAEGDEVITVSHSFIATAIGISWTGAKPIFLDIDPDVYTMDPNLLEDFLKKRKRRRVKAILPVHLYGHALEMDAIMDLASRYHLMVIEDACQAHGAEYRGRRIGSFGHLACFSFYPTKNLGAYGDGGMVVTDDKRYDERLRLLRRYGEKRKYEHILKGWNSRLDEMQAAILRVKLKYLDHWNGERRKKALMYKRLLEDTGVNLPIEKEQGRHVYHLFVIRTKQRNALRAFLKEKGIETLIHYPVPIHLQKAYRELAYRRGDLPVTEKVAHETLSLPFYPELTSQEMSEVQEQVRKFFE